MCLYIYIYIYVYISILCLHTISIDIQFACDLGRAESVPERAVGSPSFSSQDFKLRVSNPP